jgi:hypothetical protein
MSDLVKKYGFGIALNSDGSDTAEIKDAICAVMNNYDFYIENSKKHKNKILWSGQEQLLRSVISK